MQGIILCGGLGTRLREVIGEKQKTMVITNGEPFIVNIMKYLKRYGVDDIIFAIGYKSEEVENYFGNNYYFGQRVRYAKETTLLGTGGAIKNCSSLISKDEVVVVNGDTIFEADINALKKCMINLNADIVIACKDVDDKKRFGTIKFKKIEKDADGILSGIISSFEEKVDENDVGDKKEQTFINGGVYLIKKSLIDTIPNGNISIEQELFPKWLKSKKVVAGVIYEKSFVDIGTPESLDNYKKRKEQWNI